MAPPLNGGKFASLMSFLAFLIHQTANLIDETSRIRRARHQRYILQLQRDAQQFRRDRRRRRIIALAVLSLLYSSSRIVDVDRPKIPQYTTWFEECVLVHYSDREWLKHFRMKRGTFMILCDALRPELTKKRTNCKAPISVEKRVAVTVWRLATPGEYRTISLLFGIGLSTACKITHEVCYAIFDNLYPQYITWPTGDRLSKVVQGFQANHGFPQCAGAVDGTHIHITAPEAQHNDYSNRKGFTSIVLQAVCDFQCRFTDVFVGFAGRAHDARILVNSTLYERGQNGTLFPPWTRRFGEVDIPLVIVGDPAYPLLPWLMKGFPETRGITREQKRFNFLLSSARILIELAFGQLKGRWRCLNKKNESHIDFMPLIVACCCVLHNFCIDHEDQFRREPLGLPEDFVHFEINPLQGLQDGQHQQDNQPIVNVDQKAIRQAILEYFQGN